jgi:REP element-mobilizing transposase RayT
MRQRRLKAPANSYADTAYYHCVSRVVNREFVFGDAEKEQFVRFMRMYERLCGVRVVTYCVMSNHFHVLVGVPKKPEVMPSNSELVKTVRATLGDLEALRLEWSLGEAAKIISTAWEAEIRERYLRRMWDISMFMKTLKQRFTQWFNKTHKRKGTIWEERFRSVLVQSAGEPLRAMAAYIDLNPIRASMVEDPAEYRWSGYGAAMGGDVLALEGLRELERVEDAGVDAEVVSKRQKERRRMTKAERHQVTLEKHRALLYGRGEERGVGKDGRALKKGFTREQASKVVAKGGRLPASTYLRCRVRYFNDGAVIGSRGFVNEVFANTRHRFGTKRKTGARLMAGLAKDEKLYSMRQLVVDVVK